MWPESDPASKVRATTGAFVKPLVTATAALAPPGVVVGATGVVAGRDDVVEVVTGTVVVTGAETVVLVVKGGATVLGPALGGDDELAQPAPRRAAIGTKTRTRGESTLWFDRTFEIVPPPRAAT